MWNACTRIRGKGWNVNVIVLAEWGTVSSSDGSERLASRTSVFRKRIGFRSIFLFEYIYIY